MGRLEMSLNDTESRSKTTGEDFRGPTIVT